MRLQLSGARQALTVVVLGCLFAGLLAALSGGTAGAEQLSQNPSGEVVFRGNYWRDRNTRVLNPTVDARQNLANGVGVGAHYLLDAITSASVASGATADMPFTELRHEAGFNVAVPLGRKHSLSGSYSYSTESDYWSHQAGLRLGLSFLQDNTVFLFGADYAHNTVGKRLGPTGYLLMGTMQSGHLLGLWTQTLSRRALMSVSYEVTILRGYQNNPYRPVFVQGAGGLERRETEHLPDARERHVIALSWHVMFPTNLSLVPHVTLRPGIRGHFDSWGLKAFNPEIATSVPVGPTEFRFLFSFYDQYATDFYRADGGGRGGYVDNTPSYGNGPVEWGTIVDGSGNVVPNYVYTSDVKLGRYSTYTWEVMFKWRLSVLGRLGWGAAGERLARTIVELTGGMWFADRAVGWQYGIPLTSDDPLAPAGCSGTCGAGFANLGLIIPL